MGLDINIGILFAQTVNFLIVVYFLHRYLYKPVLSMLDKRKKEVEEGIALKQSMEIEKEKLAERKRKIIKEANDEGQRIIAAAIVEAKKEEERLVEKARAESQEEFEKRMATVEKERTKLIDQARREAISYAVLISEKLLEEKISKREQDKLLQDALERIKQA